VLPILVALWQTDATVHGAIEEQIQSSYLGAGSVALLTGGEVAFDTSAIGSRSTWTLRADGRYANAFGLSFSGGADAPTGTGSFDVAGTGTWQVTPRAQLSLDAQGSIASRFGMRALEGTTALDPFQAGNRLTYAFGSDAGLFASVGKQSSLRLGGGFLQEGGLAADVAEAVGLDAFTVRGEIGWGREVGGRDTIVPELRIAETHFEHAILDVDLHRGRMDTTALTARVGDTHVFSRRFTAEISAGATVTRSELPGSAAPITLTAAPEARVGLTWVGRAMRAGASYSLGFASLGPRVAYGQQHTLAGELALRPIGGAKWRDLLVHATARFAHGAAAVGIPARAGSGEAPGRGWVTTTSVAAGALVEVPLARGVALRGGIDLQLASGAIDPAPPGGAGGVQLQTVVLFGIAGTLSTDPARTVRKDPLEEELARERAAPGAWQRIEDRAREYRPRPGDATDPDLIDSDREPPGDGDADGDR
jgi:hypothetical protein